MKNRRAGVGVVLFAAGATAVAVPGVAPSLPIARGLVVLTGLSLVAAGVGYGVTTVRRPMAGVTPSTPEDSIDLPGPGEDTEQQLRTLSTTPDNPDDLQKWRETKKTVESHINNLAVATMRDRWGVEEQEAEEFLTVGTWSEDPHAVAFFTGSYPEWTPASVSARVDQPLVDFSVGMRARHAIDEIGAIEAGERDPPAVPASRDRTVPDQNDDVEAEAADAGTDASEERRWGETS